METLTGKTTGYVSKPHSNLESTKCANDYNLIPELITHLPNPGMSEPSSIACDLRNLIPEATQVSQSQRRDNKPKWIYEYSKSNKSKATLYAYLGWWYINEINPRYQKLNDIS